MASSVIEQLNTPFARWTNWTIANAVKEGYKVSGWVFKAVSLISKNIAMVPWQVVDSNGEPVKEHPITLLLQNPNPAFSRQDFFELISAWQQLSGEAYVKTISVDGQIKEIWPISPDRITPIESKEPSVLVASYEVINEDGKKVNSSEFTPENIISFRFLDPSNPIRGIGPLQVAAKAVDIDQEQLNWNKSAMQNRGVLDGVFTFKERIDEGTYTVIKQKIKELFQGSENARDIGVIGSNATYQRLSLTPAEMDFIDSRKFNREEIFIIFGVPPQLAGVQESSTYNNFNTSRVIFWETTLIPILDDLKNTFNRAFKEQLGNYTLTYDLSDVPALKKDLKEKAETAKVYSDMGVPMKQLNEMFKLGVPEYEGWDKSVKATQQPTQGENRGTGSLMLKKLEKRDIQDIIELKEHKADKAQRSFHLALQEQQVTVFKALEESSDIVGAIVTGSDKLETTINSFYRKTAVIFAGSVLVDRRGIPVDFETRAVSQSIVDSIEDFLIQEGIILNELSLINKSTIAKIFDAVIDGESEGKSINEVQQAILDSGTFSPERALRLARTISGTAQSIGQMAGALSVGATKKKWWKGSTDSRSAHQARDGEVVGINDTFSRQFSGGRAPRYPLDQLADVADRVNCTCSMTFEV